jgi:high-affinity iron transporter
LASGVASVGLSMAALAGAPAPSDDMLAAGRAAYASTCMPCHGATGEGNGPVAFAIKPPPRNFKTDPFKAGDSLEQIFATITNGLPNTRMVGYPQLPEHDRWGLAYLVRGFRGKP